jgi:hypothetical protein
MKSTHSERERERKFIIIYLFQSSNNRISQTSFLSSKTKKKLYIKNIYTNNICVLWPNYREKERERKLLSTIM